MYDKLFGKIEVEGTTSITRPMLYGQHYTRIEGISRENLHPIFKAVGTDVILDTNGMVGCECKNIIFKGDAKVGVLARRRISNQGMLNRFQGGAIIGNFDVAAMVNCASEMLSVNSMEIRQLQKSKSALLLTSKWDDLPIYGETPPNENPSHSGGEYNCCTIASDGGEDAIALKIEHQANNIKFTNCCFSCKKKGSFAGVMFGDDYYGRNVRSITFDNCMFELYGCKYGLVFNADTYDIKFINNCRFWLPLGSNLIKSNYGRQYGLQLDVELNWL